MSIRDSKNLQSVKDKEKLMCSREIIYGFISKKKYIFKSSILIVTSCMKLVRLDWEDEWRTVLEETHLENECPAPVLKGQPR